MVTFSTVLFQTVTVWPELSRFFTIPLPMIPRPRKPKFSLLGWMSFSLRIWLLVTRSMSKAGLAGRAKEGLSSRLETAALDFFMVGVCIGLSDLPSPSLKIVSSV